MHVLEDASLQDNEKNNPTAPPDAAAAAAAAQVSPNPSAAGGSTADKGRAHGAAGAKPTGLSVDDKMKHWVQRAAEDSTAKSSFRSMVRSLKSRSNNGDSKAEHTAGANSATSANRQDVGESFSKLFRRTDLSPINSSGGEDVSPMYPRAHRTSEEQSSELDSSEFIPMHKAAQKSAGASLSAVQCAAQHSMDGADKTGLGKSPRENQRDRESKHLRASLSSIEAHEVRQEGAALTKQLEDQQQQHKQQEHRGVDEVAPRGVPHHNRALGSVDICTVGRDFALYSQQLPQTEKLGNLTEAAESSAHAAAQAESCVAQLHALQDALKATSVALDASAPLNCSMRASASAALSGALAASAAAAAGSSRAAAVGTAGTTSASQVQAQAHIQRLSPPRGGPHGFMQPQGAHFGMGASPYQMHNMHAALPRGGMPNGVRMMVPQQAIPPTMGASHSTEMSQKKPVSMRASLGGPVDAKHAIAAKPTATRKGSIRRSLPSTLNAQPSWGFTAGNSVAGSIMGGMHGHGHLAMMGHASMQPGMIPMHAGAYGGLASRGGSRASSSLLGQGSWGSGGLQRGPASGGVHAKQGAQNTSPLGKAGSWGSGGQQGVQAAANLNRSARAMGNRRVHAQHETQGALMKYVERSNNTPRLGSMGATRPAAGKAVASSNTKGQHASAQQKIPFR